MERPFPAYRGDDPYVFVCYAHADADVVFPELERLRDQGVNVFYDEGIAPGHEWTQELADAIDRASRFLYFVSPASVASRHCRNEAQYALSQDKPVVAVYLEPTELPGGLKLSLGSTQAIVRYELGAEEYARKLAATFAGNHGAGNLPSSPERAAPRKGRPIVPAALLTVLVLTAVMAWRFVGIEGLEPSTQESSSEGQPTLAVLPFVNMSGDAGQEFFSDGVAEDILTGLARQQSLVVRARDSSFLFKGREADPREIARALGVRYLVNGSVRSQGNQVRVTVRLTDTASNADIWSNRYDRKLADVFAVQDEITESVVRELGAQFSAVTRQPVNIAAYEAFLRGRNAYHRQAFDVAEEHLRAAIELDPEYAEAHALLARVYGTEAWNSPIDLHELVVQSQTEIAAALALDPDQPLARGLQAMMLPIQPAIAELHALVEQYPNDEAQLFFFATRMRQIGRREMEMAILDRYFQLNPLPCPIPYVDTHLFYGRIEGARAGLERCDAAGIPYPVGWGKLAILEGDLAEARRQAERSLSDWSVVPAFWRPMFDGIVAYAEGDRDAVERALAPLKSRRDELPLYVRSLTASLEGDNDEALALYRSALEHGEPLAFNYIQGQAQDRLLFPEFFDDPRYAAMLSAYGLDEASIARLDVPPLPF